METVLVIAYLLGGQLIDTEIFESANMEECQVTKKNALAGPTPITTRYGDNVKIAAECKFKNHTTALPNLSPAF